MAVLGELAPRQVFRYFEELCGIPHGSGNTKAISEYCMAFARRHGLDAEQDAYNNVLIRKPGSAGYENHPPVILQGHLDMVCEKEPECTIDFARDGLELFVEGDWIGARGTTLGGDDGIAVAMGLAILEDDTLAHPPLEVLFTTDEETGMDGAVGLDASRLKGRTLINADSEEEGVLTVGCAGGARAELRIPVTREPVSAPCYTVTVDGLIGGHSGAEIHKGRLNSNIVMGRFLQSLPEGFRLVKLVGGLKDNAIPRQTVCLLAGEDPTAAAAAFTAANRIPADPELTVTVAPAPAAATAVTAADSRRVAAFLTTVKNGVQAMSRHIDGLVETSLNLGVLELEETALRATFSVRSSVGASKTALLADLEQTAAAFGGTYSSHGHYPAWEYREVSPLRDVMVAVYEKLTGQKPVVKAIHAGLECGLFSEKLPGLDAVSFGPRMRDIHTTRERLCISSTGRTYAYLCRVLEKL